MRVTRTGWEPSDVSGYFAITPIKSWLNWLNVWVWDRPYTEINRRAKDYKLRVWSWITRINWDLAVTPFGLSSSENTTEFYVNKNGISMFWSPYFFRTNGNNNIRWLSVNWPIFAWHSGNYIYMYADWDSPTANNRSYEILWENELAVGTRWWAFIYFTQRTGTYNNITGGSYPWVTLDLSGTTQAYSCPGGWGTSKWNQGWWWLQQIVYWEQNLSWQCSGVNVQVHTWHSWHGINPLEVFGGIFGDNTDMKKQVYSSLMVWVNTDDPQATLDVNGSLRLGSNCLPSSLTCDASNVGTMMYLERKATYQWSLVICVADGITWNNNDGYTVDYKWYDIMRWLAGTNLSELWFNVNNNDEFSCILPKPNAGVYPMPADPIEFESEPENPIPED